METVAVFEAKNRFSELLAAVAHGEEITITRHGSPVARLVALGAGAQVSAQQPQRVLDAMQRLRELGSVVHGDDTDDSDLDLLVEPTSETTMMDIAKIQLELAQLLKVTVDVLTPKGLPVKFRAQVIAEALPL